ncbi:MAG: winged helix-turn-helix domain-containing protein [Thermoplasmata archaeon]|nr:winged helix-turn-helix domain-containing protein [Thermoplasmata archaeon]
MPLDALELAQLLTDGYVAKILIATSRKPKSALELSERFGIPVAQCYRRIHALESAGLVKAVDRVLTREGKRIYLYKSLVKNVQIYYEGTKVKVKLTLMDTPEPEIERTAELIAEETRITPQQEQEKKFSMLMMKSEENKEGG